MNTPLPWPHPLGAILIRMRHRQEQNSHFAFGLDFFLAEASWPKENTPCIMPPQGAMHVPSVHPGNANVRFVYKFVGLHNFLAVQSLYNICRRIVHRLH